jgi:hypothetical protein
MFSKLVHLALIAALVACPLCCLGADSPCQCICGGAVSDGSRDAASFSADECPAFVAIVPICNQAVEQQLATAGVSGEYNDFAAHPRRFSCLYSVWRC